MLLRVEIIAIIILVITLIVLLIEERRIKKSKIPKGAIKEYWNGKERRQTRRINSQITVKYSIEKKYHIKSDGRTKDISIGGMRLLINEKLSHGTLLLLEFEVPESKNAICAEGKVIWAEGAFFERDEANRRTFQTGIQFVNIKSDDKNRLLAYIERNIE